MSSDERHDPAWAHPVQPDDWRGEAGRATDVSSVSSGSDGEDFTPAYIFKSLGTKNAKAPRRPGYDEIKRLETSGSAEETAKADDWAPNELTSVMRDDTVPMSAAFEWDSQAEGEMLESHPGTDDDYLPQRHNREGLKESSPARPRTRSSKTTQTSEVKSAETQRCKRRTTAISLASQSFRRSAGSTGPAATGQDLTAKEQRAKAKRERKQKARSEAALISAGTPGSTKPVWMVFSYSNELVGESATRNKIYQPTGEQTVSIIPRDPQDSHRLYKGAVVIRSRGSEDTVHSVPLNLHVFTVPDDPSELATFINDTIQPLAWKPSLLGEYGSPPWEFLRSRLEGARKMVNLTIKSSGEMLSSQIEQCRQSVSKDTVLTVCAGGVLHSAYTSRNLSLVVAYCDVRSGDTVLWSALPESRHIKENPALGVLPKTKLSVRREKAKLESTHCGEDVKDKCKKR